MDSGSLAAVERYLGRAVAPAGTGAMLVVEVDGVPGGVEEEAALVEEACRVAGALSVHRAATEEERRAAVGGASSAVVRAARLGAAQDQSRRLGARAGACRSCSRCWRGCERDYRLWIPSFGHAGDGNIHVNLMVDPDDADEMAPRRATRLRRCSRAWCALEGSISGEHGIGFAKAPYLSLELAPDVIALMQRVKAAFDPHGILNPGKIWETGETWVLRS